MMEMSENCRSWILEVLVRVLTYEDLTLLSYLMVSNFWFRYFLILEALEPKYVSSMCFMTIEMKNSQPFLQISISKCNLSTSEMYSQFLNRLSYNCEASDILLAPKCNLTLERTYFLFETFMYPIWISQAPKKCENILAFS